jgi:uncharacterized membrane protein YeiH
MVTDLPTILTVLDLAAAVVFATTGALVASRKEMDILGFMWLGVITGIGGHHHPALLNRNRLRFEKKL